jgi:anti-anti-sigma factor
MESDTRTWSSCWGQCLVTMTCHRNDTHTIAEVSGCLDPHQGLTLAKELRSLLPKGTGNLIVDLTRVDFLDAVSTGALRQTQHHLQRQGRALHVVAAEGGLALKLLRLVGMSRIFHIHTDTAAALTAADAAQPPANPHAATRDVEAPTLASTNEPPA